VVPDEGRIEIVLVRGAFGSGEHETTRSCLEVLEQLEELSGASVLDFGSGTGILAIAALKLGARRALCLDNDPSAVATARGNCHLNALDDSVEHRLGTLEAVGAAPFDVVLANIYTDVLRAEAPNLVARTRPGGVLLLSGIPLEDEFEIRRLYERQGCAVRWNRVLEDYGTVLLERA
jgi:ribosomal protein L11 methyltransferase